MSKMVDEEIRGLLRFGDEAGACVAAPDHRLLVALRRRLGEEGMVVSPVRGLYALRSEWEELGPSERSLSIMRGLQRLHPGWVFCGPSAALAFVFTVLVNLMTNRSLDRIDMVGALKSAE